MSTRTTPATPSTLDLDEARARGFEIPAQVLAPPRLTQRHPGLYPWAVRLHRVRRRWAWLRSDAAWATHADPDDLAVRVKKHASLLMRELSPDEMALQRNKVVNLRLASARVDGILIRPGESFSFNRVVGNCTARKGYVEGMRLSNGAARPGVGGGICQLANLLHWMVLHSPLTVTERSEHSFDPFPDNGRVLPWGVGCSIVYNYVDLVVRNDTNASFTVFTKVGERYLEGELRTDVEPRHTYKVYARGEGFLRRRGSSGEEIFRHNEIWRDAVDRRTGNVVGSELLKRNCALVKYTPQNADIVDV